MPPKEDYSEFTFNRPGKYRIRVLGALDASFSEKLAGFHFQLPHREDQEGIETEFVVSVRDQAELLGILTTLYDLHLTLISVEMQDDEQ
jgi:hypothetical protein